MKSVILSDKRKLIIRDATTEDARIMCDHMNDISKESDNLSFGDGEFGKSIEEEGKLIKDYISKDNAIFIIAEIDGVVAGHLTFEGGFRKRLRHSGEFGIAIRKNFWGLGIGTILIQHLIDWASSGEIITKINLMVRTDNVKAIKLYEKLGFKHQGTITRDLLIDGVYYDAYNMGMEIN